MPIRPTTTVDIREQIALMILNGKYTVTEVAELFGVTRPTVYKYRDRYCAEGRAGLFDRSRAPHSPRKTPEWVIARIIEERRRFGFGSKKIRRRMLDEEPDGHWPARSTIDEIFRREGLTKPRKRRSSFRSPFRRVYEADRPGELTTIDFKGEFRLRNSRWCHPLTMADSVSRFLFACEALPSIHLDGVWPVAERVFREHGLPDAVLSDNGSPFGGHGVSRFSTFSVRLMELGVQPVFIAPGHPEQNGRHERMHKTLKERLGSFRPRSFAEAQRFFDDFRFTFNHERPHEALDFDRPAKRHQPGHRPFPAGRPSIHYPDSFEVRTVTCNGTIKWQGHHIFLSHAFTGRKVGLQPLDDGIFDVHFGSFLIGRLDERERRFV